MRINTSFNRPVGEKDQETAHSATVSPIVGAPAQLDEDHLDPCNETYPFSDIAFRSSEEISQSGYYEEVWTELAITSSPESSETSAFTPAEDILCSSSPFGAPPDSQDSFASSIPSFKINGLHDLAAEGGMQSPASFYPNSPTDSFADSDVPTMPPSSVSSTSALYNMDSMKMEITSAPRIELLDVSNPGKGDEPYCQLLGKCLRTMPDYSMCLKDIYKWFEENTTKTDQDGKGWQNSIRHNLSMNGAFIKQQDVTHPQPSADAADKGSSRSKNNVWTMTEEAVKNGVQSTTRYRKPNSERKRAKKLAHSQQHRALPYGNYSLSGNEYNRAHTMDRAAAGRRGGVATRHARERQRLEQQHLANNQQSLPLVDIGNGGWAIPRTCSPEMMAAFPMADHFRSGAPNHGMSGYMGIQGGVPMSHQLIYSHPLPSSSSSSTMGVGSSHASTPTAHMSTIPGHPNVSLGCVPSADPRCGTNQASPQQQQQQQHHLHTAGAQPHQHNGGFHYGSPTSAGEYGSGNGLHQPESSSAHHPSFAPMSTGLKDWNQGTSGAGGV